MAAGVQAGSLVHVGTGQQGEARPRVHWLGESTAVGGYIGAVGPRGRFAWSLIARGWLTKNA